MTRRSALLLLLGSMDDHLPALGANLRPQTGLAPVERRACPVCQHSGRAGWLQDRFGRFTPCGTCGGQLPATAGRGFVNVDPMDSDQQPIRTRAADSVPPTRPAAVVTCDGCGGSGVGGAHLDDRGEEYRDPCRYCNGSGRRTITRFDLQLDRERGEGASRLDCAIDSRDAAGSYHALDWALTTIPTRRRALVLRCHGPAASVDSRDLPPGARAALERTLVELEQRMPAVIRVPGDVRKAARAAEDHLRKVKGLGASKQALAARDKEIRRLVRQGRPRQWVAREFGLSVSQVNRLVTGEKEAA